MDIVFCRKGRFAFARNSRTAGHFIFYTKYFKDVSREVDEFRVNTHPCKLRSLSAVNCWVWSTRVHDEWKPVGRSDNPASFSDFVYGVTLFWCGESLEMTLARNYPRAARMTVVSEL